MTAADFLATDRPNPHVKRAVALLRAHPEARGLVGHYPPTGLWILLAVAFQLLVAWGVSGLAWPWVVALAWLVGAVPGHSLFVLQHEAAHDLITGRSTWDRWWGILCNVGQGFPAAMSFRSFHLLHHSRMGEYAWDGDLASRTEARWVGSGPVRKTLWMLLFGLVETVRPLHLKRSAFDRWLVINFLVIVATNVALFALFGWKGLAYLVLATFFGIGLHPLGARWIQEHYVFRDGQETYSYYGPANRLAFNVGYHNEHHDLAGVPWVHLPRLRAMAPELYDDLYAHHSWSRLLWRFIRDPEVDLYSRIVRERGNAGPGKKPGEGLS